MFYQILTDSLYVNFVKKQGDRAGTGPRWFEPVWGLGFEKRCTEMGQVKVVALD